MVLFDSANDRRLFLLEVGKGVDDTDTEDDHHLFIKKRKRTVSLIKDFLKRRRAQRGWARHRASLMTGIKNYHQSSKGQKFHRQLGRFLSLRARLFNSPAQGEVYYMSVVDQANLELLNDELAELGKNRC